MASIIWFCIELTLIASVLSLDCLSFFNVLFRVFPNLMLTFSAAVLCAVNFWKYLSPPTYKKMSGWHKTCFILFFIKLFLNNTNILLYTPCMKTIIIFENSILYIILRPYIHSKIMRCSNILPYFWLFLIHCNYN